MWTPILLPWPNNLGNTFERTALRTSTTEIFVRNDRVLFSPAWSKAKGFLAESGGMLPGSFLKSICTEMESGAF